MTTTPKRPGANVPTMEERIAAITREELAQPHGITEAVAYYLDRAPRYGAVSYACNGCAEEAAADNPREIQALLEHVAFDHISPADVLCIKEPQIMTSGARLQQWLARSR